MKKIITINIIFALLMLGVVYFNSKDNRNVGGGEGVETGDFCKGQECFVQVKINKEEGGKRFQDARYYSEQEWGQKTSEEIEADVTERFENWKQVVEELSKKALNENNI
jgi:hypothetical protein